MSFADAVYTAMTALLAVSGAALLYPAVRGVQVVVYRRAVFLLGASTLLLVAGWVSIYLRVFEFVHQDAVVVASLGVLTVSAALHFVAAWRFARDFVEFEPSQVEIQPAGSRNGGFGDERE